ncbi:hypothetical protein HDV01_001733 [Terramyces sp. JEL0728]|nr:hypothetical protein HDV01_001733 [Terramyces sp. JEL0728]
MNNTDTLQWIVFTLTLALLTASLYLLTVIARGKLVSPTFRTKVWIILLISILQASCNIYAMIDGTNSVISRLPGSLAQWTVFFICFFNIHILQVFSVLNTKITKTNLLVGKIVIILLYLPTAFTQPWYWANADETDIPNLVLTFNAYGVLGFSVFAVLYDNIQGYYLIYLVLKSKKKKGKEVKRTLNILVICIAILSLMDWIAVGMFACASYIPSISNNQSVFQNIMKLTDTYTGVHGIFMTYVFKLLTDFTLVDSRRYQIKKSKERRTNPTQREKSNIGTRKHSEVDDIQRASVTQAIN